MRECFALVALTLLASLAACDALIAAPSIAADPSCKFPTGTRLLFAERTTLVALGLDQLGPEEAHDQVGMIFVTSEPIQHEALGPGSPPRRVYCGVYDEGSVVSQVIGPVPADWRPPPTAP